MAKLSHGLGFARPELSGEAQGCRYEGITGRATRRAFPPEFLNRIDATITYRPLDASALDAILDQQLDDLQDHIDYRLGHQAFDLLVEEDGRWKICNPPYWLLTPG